MTPAWLHLRGITFDAILGCHPSERTTPRPVVVDLSVQLDISKAAATDSLPDTLNTETLETLVLDTAQAGQFHLLETDRNREGVIKSLETRGSFDPRVKSDDRRGGGCESIYRFDGKGIQFRLIDLRQFQMIIRLRGGLGGPFIETI